MNLKEYQRLAMRTSPDGHDRVKNGCLGLIGESGEIVDIIKKHMFQSEADTPLPVGKIIDEMGDVLWYCMETLTGIGDDPEIALTRKALYSVSAVYIQSCAAGIDTVAALLSMFSVGAYTASYIDDNIRHLRGCIYDVYRMLLTLCDLLGTTIERVAETNIEKLKKRYPDGFDPKRSMNRPEYQRNEQTESASGILFSERNRTI